MNIKDFSLLLLASDISAIPVKQDKRPPIEWKRYQSEPMTDDEAEQHFAKSWGIAVICGKVSGNLECIDFDAHNNDIQHIYEQFLAEPHVEYIVNSRPIYVERSMRGGIHLIYRYESDTKCDGNLKLASWEDGQSMIETRGEGGYVITAPTPGYTTTHGDLTRLAPLTIEERDFLLDHARKFCRKPKAKEQTEPDKPGYDGNDPISYYNWNKADHAKMLLRDIGWTMTGFDEQAKVEQWCRPGKADGISATWGKNHNALYVFSSSAEHFTQNCYYTPFQILVKLKYKGNYRQAIQWIEEKYMDVNPEYVRVGTDYFKVIEKPDRFGIRHKELKGWTKEEIKQDFGKAILDKIPRYDDFTIVPDNMNYDPVVSGCYNLYKPFSHKPEPGRWSWSETLMHHIFGDQYGLGLRYMQALYLHPDKMLPILVLVSKERQTGKTTFINWLNMIFGGNMANINPEDLVNSFNSAYATSNIIAVEETLIEKSITVEKLKALATGKFISVNAKYIQQYKIPFFGKIILASNNEDKFARIDEQEIRFWVRKVDLPTQMNHAIEDELLKEIPAFLHYLTTLPPIDWTRDRSGFTPDELQNDTLRKVKEESKSGLFKDLNELIYECFANNPRQPARIMASPADIKERFFKSNTRIDLQYIRHVLKDEFKKTPLPVQRYTPFEDDFAAVKLGRPYEFKPNEFNLDYSDCEMLQTGTPF